MTRAGPPGWPFVGRRLQLLELARTLEDPACSGVLLVGGSGVGKTRTAQEMLALADAAGGVSDWLVATAAAAEIPFGALARWLPGHDAAANLTSSGVAVFHAAARKLTDQAGGRPLTVGIDDVHHLDPSSAVLLHHLVHTRVAKLVLTLRSRQELPEPVTSLWKDGLLHRVDLGPLTRPEVDELLTRVFAGPLDPALAAQFWRATAGNLLYLRELVAAARASGALQHLQGRWQLKGDLPPSPPLVELVENRIAGASADARDILDLVALGEPLPLEILETLAPVDAIVDLERSELLVVEPDNRRQTVRLTHPMYADVIRTRTGSRRSRSLARRLAAAYLAAGLRRDGDLLRYVVWELDGGGTCDGPLLRRAAFLALQSADPVLAERLARAATRAQPGDLAAAFALIEALARQGRFDECMAILAEVPVTGEPGRTLLRRARVNFLFWAYGDGPAAEAELDRLDREVTDPESRLLLLSTRAAMRCQAGEVSEAARLAAAVLAEATSPRLRWEATGRLSLSLAMMGRAEEAMALAGEAFEITARPDVVVPPDLDLAGAAMTLASFHAGRLDFTQLVAETTYANGLSLDNSSLRMVGAAARGVVAVARGSLEEAGSLLAEAVSLLRPTDIDGLRSLVLGMEAYAAALTGDLAGAEKALVRARAEAHRTLLWFLPLLEQGQACLLAASGRTAEAVGHLEQTAAGARRRGQRSFELTALFEAARLGAGPSSLEPLAEVAGDTEGELPALAGRYARARLAGAGADLDATADGFEAIGMILVAAQVAGDGAAAHGPRGDRLTEARSLRRCRELGDRCPGLAPWVLRERLARDTLTVREREVAHLVASGRSNKEVAAAIGVSTRTVESHLDRVYGKLGINDRAQLAGVFGGPS